MPLLLSSAVAGPRIRSRSRWFRRWLGTGHFTPERAGDRNPPWSCAEKELPSQPGLHDMGKLQVVLRKRPSARWICALTLQIVVVLACLLGPLLITFGLAPDPLYDSPLVGVMVAVLLLMTGAVLGAAILDFPNRRRWRRLLAARRLMDLKEFMSSPECSACDREIARAFRHVLAGDLGIREEIIFPLDTYITLACTRDATDEPLDGTTVRFLMADAGFRMSLEEAMRVSDEVAVRSTVAEKIACLTSKATTATAAPRVRSRSR